jgi:hypothetical protein
MTHAALGNDVVGKALHFGPASLEHRDFHATLLIEVHVQGCLCEVVVFVEIACEPQADIRVWSENQDFPYSVRGNNHKM